MSEPAKEAAGDVKAGAKKGTDKLRALMTRKVGPLPVGLWLVGIGGGLLLSTYLRNRSNSSDGAAVDAVEDPTATGGGWAADGADTAVGGSSGVGGSGPTDDYGSYDYTDYGADPGFETDNTANGVGGDVSYVSTGGVAQPVRAGGKGKGTIPDPVPPVGGYASNGQWRNVAVADLAARGWTRMVADTALRDYLAGRKLNDKERSAVAAAIRHCGPPPSPPGPKAGAGGTPSPTPTGGNNGGNGNNGGGAGNGGSGGGGGGGGGPIVGHALTNSDWRRAVTDRMAQGGWNRDKVNDVLGDWLNQRPVKDKDRDIINRAIQLAGQPPNPPRK